MKKLMLEYIIFIVMILVYFLGFMSLGFASIGLLAMGASDDYSAMPYFLLNLIPVSFIVFYMYKMEINVNEK